MTPGNKNSYNSLKKITVNDNEYNYYSLNEAEKNGLEGINKLPKSLKVLLENLLRYEDDLSVTKSQIEAIKNWLKTKKSKTEIAYRPARVLLQDYTGIPAVADLAAMREAVKEKNKDPNTINPLSAVDLVIDHSVQVDQSAKADSFEKNVDIEFERNGERYSFLKWGQQAFDNFRIVPPGTGICHQVNLEYLSKVVWSEEFKGEKYLFPDTLVGTDSHTTMVNGLSVLGWGVGGIEAEAGSPEAQTIREMIKEVFGREISEDSGLGIKPVSRTGSQRLQRAAIKYAVERGRKNIHWVHKGNIMKYTEGAFQKWGYELVKEEFDDVAVGWDDCGGDPGDKILVQDAIADIALQQVLTRPAEFDVIATMNLNGDYLSDALAAQVGGIGIAPGANINYVTGHGIFEATHGTAPKYAGQDKVNPSSVLLSGVLMFEHLGWRDAADDIIKAVEQTIGEKIVTYDFARLMDGATEVKCSEFASAIVDRL